MKARTAYSNSFRAWKARLCVTFPVVAGVILERGLRKEDVKYKIAEGTSNGVEAITLLIFSPAFP